MADTSAPSHAKNSDRMSRIILISDCALNFIFPEANSSWPLSLYGHPAGCIFNAATLLAKLGKEYELRYVGETAADPLGNMLVNHLKASGIDTQCIDQYTDGGVTPTNIIIPDSQAIVNRRYPADDNLRLTWPRIDAGDIVIFGGFFAINDRTRRQVTELVQYAAERKALTIYIPEFLPAEVSRITKVMPAILENIETADMVITSTDSLSTIWGTTDATKCYMSNVRFYCPTMIHVDTDLASATIFHKEQTGTCSVTGNQPLSTVVAAVARHIALNQLTPADVKALTPHMCTLLCNAITNTSAS